MSTDHRRSRSQKRTFMNNMLDEIFYPENPICQIISTGSKKKKDVFNDLRPEPKSCLDYNISQTDAKMDAGDTKIHIKQTIANYVPNPEAPPKKIKVPKKGRNKYFSGGPPQYEFLDELWKQKQEELQKDFHKNFKLLVAARKKSERNRVNGDHRRIVKLVGPSWYKELSPSQITTINNLKNCILKDLAGDTTGNTEDNISDLGLVLRPNHRHIEKAIKNCCKCPIEFLLVLYQLINPKRKRYSINDRLLLSAVVHLTMMETLKELHIRIPSPPPPPKIAKNVEKKKHYVKYASPYLVPYTFEREKPKFSGIYRDKHVQRPQSPYFCYLEQFEKMKLQAGFKYDDLDFEELPGPSSDDEIEIEWRIAQRFYESLVDFRPVPILLKPSRFIPCDNFRNKPNTIDGYVIEETDDEGEEEEEEGEEEGDEVEFSVDSLVFCDCPQETQMENKETFCCCIAEKQKSLEDKSCQSETDKDAKKCTCNPETEAQPQEEEKDEQENVDIEGDAPKETEEEVTIDDTEAVKEDEVTEEPETSTPEKIHPCACSKPISVKDSSKSLPTVVHMQGMLPQNEKDKIANKKKYEEFGSTWTQCGTTHGAPEAMQYNEYQKSRYYQANANEVEGENENPPCKHVKQLEIYHQMYDLLRFKKEKRGPCKCREKSKKRVAKPLCECERCRAERIAKTTHLVISGMAETDDEETVPVIESLVEDKRCDCLKKYLKQVEAVEKEREEESQKHCSCRKVTKKQIDAAFCDCDQCKEDRRAKAAKHIIGGIKESENLKIIEGISMGKPCDCAKKFIKRANEYEYFEKRKKMIAELKRQPDKYVIGGVTNTKNGPVYVISGLRPPIDCICAKKHRQEIKDAHMRAIMPKVPAGRVMYNIVGVRETPTGNVYVLSDALPIDPCDCEVIYKEFEQQHATCTQLYEQYLAKMREDYNEFMEEMLPRASSRKDLSKASGELLEGEETKEEETKEEDAIQETKEEGAVEEENLGEQNAEEVVKPKSEEKVVEDKEETCLVQADDDVCDCGKQYPCCVPCPPPVECKSCVCGQDPVVECIDCTCGPSEVEEEEVEEEEPTLKRFFIFDKIFCNPRWQRRVLKKALESMAEDGFPLAKLPQCYKLPHFKLWMQMRCRMFWTKEDRYAYIFRSKDFWRHTDYCNVYKDIFPKMRITRSQGHLLDWSKADYCRQLVFDYKDKFYRKIKQNQIHFGREFFPTTFSYEFPFKTWRDCYFAYTPTNEKEVYSRYIWQKHEFKNFADMQRFCH